jgi:hypothetical protein
VIEPKEWIKITPRFDGDNMAGYNQIAGTHIYDTASHSYTFVSFAEWERLKNALVKIDKTLSIPAAEYVPAIGDVFDIIDAALGLDGSREGTEE